MTRQSGAAKLLGAWMALTQRETWSIVEAVMKLYHPWTDLNVHKITPVMTFEAMKAIVTAE